MAEVTGLIKYGTEVAIKISEYLGIPEYLNFKVAASKYGRPYVCDDAQQFWTDAKNRSRDDRGKYYVHNGKAIRLENFNLTEWFPWSPGLYWNNPHGDSPRWDSRNVDFSEKLTDIGILNRPLSEMQKTLAVLSGVGAIRMLEHNKPNSKIKIKVLGATTEDKEYQGSLSTSGGIPVVMSERAYESVKDEIEDEGVIKARQIEGICAEIPFVGGRVADVAVNIPKYCIYVEHENRIGKTDPGENVTSAGFSLVEDEQGDYYFAFSSFYVKDDQGPIKASEFLYDYIKERNGKALTDFDEKTTRLPATFPITDIATRGIDYSKIRTLVAKIWGKYCRQS